LKTLARRLVPIAFALASLSAWGQSPGVSQPGVSQQGAPQPGGQAQPVQANLNLIIAQVQKAALATNGDLGKLRIEKWKTDSDQKDQLQKISDSIQRNLTNAVPGLIGDIQNSHGNVSATFKLYHNMTIVYEYLTSLTDAAGVLGKREEYEPLAADAAALDSARENLSTYIQQQATTYESRVRTPPPGGAPAQARPGTTTVKDGLRTVTGPDGVKHIVVDDAPDAAATPAKKKTSKPSPKSAAKPSPSPSPSPK
jgi:TolA-binding protein